MNRGSIQSCKRNIQRVFFNLQYLNRIFQITGAFFLDGTPKNKSICNEAGMNDAVQKNPYILPGV